MKNHQEKKLIFLFCSWSRRNHDWIREKFERNILSPSASAASSVYIYILLDRTEHPTEIAEIQTNHCVPWRSTLPTDCLFLRIDLLYWVRWSPPPSRSVALSDKPTIFGCVESLLWYFQYPVKMKEILRSLWRTKRLKRVVVFLKIFL